MFSHDGSSPSYDPSTNHAPPPARRPPPAYGKRRAEPTRRPVTHAAPSGTEGLDLVCRPFADKDPPVLVKQIDSLSIQRLTNVDGVMDYDTVVSPIKDDQRLIPTEITKERILEIFGPGRYRIQAFDARHQVISNAIFPVGGGVANAEDPQAQNGFGAGYPGFDPNQPPPAPLSHGDGLLGDRLSNAERLEQKAEERERELRERQDRESTRSQSSLEGFRETLLTLREFQNASPPAHAVPSQSLDALTAQLSIAQARVQMLEERVGEHSKRMDEAMAEKRRALQAEEDHSSTRLRLQEKYYDEKVKGLEQRVEEQKREIAQLQVANLTVTREKMRTETDLVLTTERKEKDETMLDKALEQGGPMLQSLLAMGLEAMKKKAAEAAVAAATAGAPGFAEAAAAAAGAVG